ncbi:hypothetical protein J1N35_031907 [Gossypium stocksii]|uniref:Acyl-coenzyme A thioesterase 13 n=1 Tax=Gossypium stocksii TaxID=47602 RepID=A0A9D3V2U3_9ROSI|nr:hypothetical protein J1N35_031907 [Gossypium stocksii]
MVICFLWDQAQKLLGESGRYLIPEPENLDPLSCDGRGKKVEYGKSQGIPPTKQRRGRERFAAHFYEDFALRGIRVDTVQPGFVSCTLTVPPRLTDRSGNLAKGAVANLVDEVGAAVVHVEGLPMNVSVDMSISFLGTAKLNDELEITSKVLGQRGSYSGTIVLVRNKATGELIAEGRHSLFGKKK